MNHEHQDEIRVATSSWICVHDDWTNIPPGCPDAPVHFHADCNRCRHIPDRCEDCRNRKCIRFHTSERFWAETPEDVRAKMRAHWANDHEPADLLEMLEAPGWNN